ncbi:hypothetical protein [Marinobacter sp.]|uniref:hypothetical protein n=1 Tax=Marinobacter sp. TaxID=50741 RepID=UPI000C8D5C8F|nr:hypothetical protein [Marinobacter sp.]MAB53587.1 hypothetical protein [Marinobacter sp.]|tara:strand:+ start:1929 stop:2393 length:465 start_codon:yes stop_codon:yes gene_type:complete
MGYQKGHYGKYTGNAPCCMDHAHTKVTSKNYKAAERDDAAHIDYLKRDVLYDDHHGHSDKKMTADEKHISKLAGDMKYDKKHHGSPMHTNHPNPPREKVKSLAEKEYEQELKREKRMPGFAEKPEGGIKTVAAENRRKAMDKISKPKAKVKIKK